MNESPLRDEIDAILSEKYTDRTKSSECGDLINRLPANERDQLLAAYVLCAREYGDVSLNVRSGPTLLEDLRSVMGDAIAEVNSHIEQIVTDMKSGIAPIYQIIWCDSEGDSHQEDIAVQPRSDQLEDVVAALHNSYRSQIKGVAILPLREVLVPR